jgi:hypothetical protein
LFRLGSPARILRMSTIKAGTFPDTWSWTELTRLILLKFTPVPRSRAENSLLKLSSGNKIVGDAGKAAIRHFAVHL